MHVDVCEEFRRLYDYKVKFSVNKRAVYYLAKYTGQRVFPQEGEVLEYWVVPYDEAVDLLTFDADREILKMREAFLKQKIRKYRRTGCIAVLYHTLKGRTFYRLMFCLFIFILILKKQGYY